MIKQSLKFGWIFLLMVMLIGCQQGSSSEDVLKGTVTLWHSWSEADAVVLEEGLAQFEEIHPGVTVVSLALPAEGILEEFVDAADDGLAPGLLLGNDQWISELAEAGQIRPILPAASEFEMFNARNRSLVEYQGELFGLPSSLAPRALYYNKRMVTEPAADLDALIIDAAAGNSVAFVPRFEQAYWGIQAFGQGLFDEQGQMTLAESGFAEWLAWLQEAQESPGVILSVDDDSLLELFATEQIAYYVGDPEDQAQITALMDDEAPFEYGVTTLPDGPEGPAGPLLPAETILFYAFMSENQERVADALARFLVNQQQSIRFMRELQRVPANPSVIVDQRVYPTVSGFARQARTAEVIPNDVAIQPTIEAGDRAYVSVLSGVFTPDEAVCRFGQEVASIEEYTAVQISLPDGCVLGE